MTGFPALFALADPAGVPTAPMEQGFAPSAARQSPTSLIMPPAPDAPAPQAEQLKLGLDMLSAKDVPAALASRDSLPVGSLDRQILSWAIATSGQDTVPSVEIIATAQELAGWPGIAQLQRHVERALLRENAPAAVVFQAIRDNHPQTTEGVIALTRAYLASGKEAEAKALLAPWWRNQSLGVEDEQKILSEFGALLSKEDHQQRFLRAIFRNRLQSAKLLAEPANMQPLYTAFVATSQRSPNATKALANVPANLRNNPATIFLKARQLRRADRDVEAAKLILTLPRTAEALIDPDAWWDDRRILSRSLIDMGKPKLAYDVVAHHAAETPAIAAEAEFHAGWYALRFLKQPKLAARHFEKIAAISSRPQSASRAYYWLGRAVDAGAEGDAKAFYRRSAHFGTTFYGQLAAARLKEKAPELNQPTATDIERSRFEKRIAVQAIRRLQAIGYGYRAAPLYIALAQDLGNVGELALLANLAASNNNHYLALRVGKIAALRGLDVGALSHPLGAIPDTAMIDSAGKALSYAIARQESEFNIGAVSTAGARGLLQIMPATAKSVATRNGLDYAPQRLTSDAAYNATLGAHFLAEQLKKFGGSYVLTIAAYNAGPKRAQEWMARLGDPRNKSIEEVVDWIERIPFSETRNYVHRVMENYEVYKTLLTGNADIEKDLTAGRQ